MEKSIADKLELAPMCKNNTDIHQTAFTVSVDSTSTGTGVSAQDRLTTIKALANDSTIPSDLRRPGHIFPLVAHSGGLKSRRGHTEAAITLCKLSGSIPVAVIGEMKGNDGKMKRRSECFAYAKANRIPIIEIGQLVKIIKKSEIELLAECDIQSEIGEHPWKMMCFGDINSPHKVFMYPNFGILYENVPVRIHSECFTGDVFKSKHCDCGQQLEQSMKYIVDNGEGLIIFPSNHEGRGIGITHKVKAYQLQKENNIDTYEANKILGFEPDNRNYDDIIKILNYLEITKVELLTENPDKIISLADIVVKTKPIIIEANSHNEKYLKAKHLHFQTKKNPIIDLTNIITNSMKIAFVYSMWHEQYISDIRSKLRSYLEDLGIHYLDEYDVPGSNEIPFKAVMLAKKYDGIICIGILIKGDTLHFENVSTAVANGIMQAQISTGTPMMNCILSCFDMDQVFDRINGTHSTLEYVARSLVKMIGDKITNKLFIC